MRQVVAELRAKRKLIHLLVIMITAMQFVSVVPSMFEHDQYPDYEYTILPHAFSCSLDEFGIKEDHITRNAIKWYLHCLSWELTGYPNALLIPFAPACLPLVYLLGYYLTRDRLIGLFSITAMLFNPLYTDWINTGTYDQVWTFFILLSLVLIFKNTGASLASWLVAAFAKSFTLGFFPMWFYSVWKIRKDRRIIVIGLGLVISGLIVISLLDPNIFRKLVGNQIGFFPENTEAAIFTNIGIFWQVLPALAIFASLSLQFKSKTVIPNKKLIAVWLVFILCTTPVIHLFTMQGTFGYRYVLFATFMSIFISVTLVQLGNWFVEMQLRKADRIAK